MRGASTVSEQQQSEEIRRQEGKEEGEEEGKREGNNLPFLLSLYPEDTKASRF
jgi:flagellar biosynthesis/type III secretory pathway protein FliH